MQIQIIGHHPFEVSEALRTYTEEKFNKLSKYFNQIVKIQITMSIERSNHKALANLYVSKENFAIRAESMDMYATIDALNDKCKMHLTKHKEKLKTHHPHNGAAKPSHDSLNGDLED